MIAIKTFGTNTASFRDFWTYIRVTQNSCPTFVTHVAQLHD